MPSPVAIRPPRPALRALAALVLGAALLVPTGALGFVAAPAGATTVRDTVEPCPDGSTPLPGERCKGPVDNTSGGGGGALTIVVSVLVGIVIAGVAFVVLRRQLRNPPPHPRHRSSPSPGAGVGEGS